MKQSNLKVQGISLLEVMLSLAIIAIILVMATRYFGIASFTNKGNEATSQVSELTQAVYRYHSDKGTYPTQLSDITNYVTDQTGKGSNAWGGGLTITSDNPTTPPVINFTNLTAKACASLADRYSTQGGTCSGTTFSVPSLQQQ